MGDQMKVEVGGERKEATAIMAASDDGSPH